MKHIPALFVLIFLTACVTASNYQLSDGTTSQSGALLTGVVNPQPNLFSTGTHICVAAIDGAYVNQDCDKPVLITAGTHDIQISADFHPFPVETGFTTMKVTLGAGQSYFIRANGGPVPFKNSNGVESLPASGLTVWIETSSGTAITDKILVSLRDQSTNQLCGLLFACGVSANKH